ncbi:DUF2147 domain-containing protein [Filomicrobium sp.]|uniref:DUF2147 domain-containing protein n=1 Tax=Filomicrobium sp. TaxID=2024831 RepID=UPI0025886459|nr:DUF2147 domain-containing protein [Filomicrobium sp.]MCV0369170.1 DUF2147 domain-containing protein [Filomicrobium sp.]
MSSLSLTSTRKLRAIAAGGAAACALVIHTAIGSAIAQEPPQELGIWYDDTGRGAVKISQCGTYLCGHIHWLKSPLNSKGEPLHDANNPNPNARMRPVCGMQVFGQLTPQGDGTWDGGWIYDPKVGKSYDVEIKSAGADVLEVRGYAGIKMFGKTLVWRKAPDDLPNCDLAEANGSKR